MAVPMCKYTHGDRVVMLCHLLKYMSHRRSVRFEIKCIVCFYIIFYHYIVKCRMYVVIHKIIMYLDAVVARIGAL